jgi:hypothetical protein
MRLRDNLHHHELQSIKDSFFHIYHSFLNEGFISKDFVGCLFKWAIQLGITEKDIASLDLPENQTQVTGDEAAIEHLYNLVYMIYLDDIVEDIELQVVSRYAEKLGFKPHIVNDLLKDIATAPYDGYTFVQVKAHLQEILEIQS